MSEFSINLLFSENPVITNEDLVKMSLKEKMGAVAENGNVDPNSNPEPFEQTEIVSDYLMDTLYNKKRVPYIEKNNGNICLKEKADYSMAIEHYNKALFAIKVLCEDRNLDAGFEYVEKVIKEVEIPVCSNLTLCYLKTGDNQNVIKYANKILEDDENNAKILYRRGMAYTNIMEFEKAKNDLMKANKLEPSDKMILKGLQTFKEKKYNYKYKTQQICQKIFDKNSEKLYEEKEVAPKDEKEEEEKKEMVGNLERGSVPYYTNKIIELGFAVPLLVYKGLLEKPTGKVLNLASSALTLTDYIPIVGGLWKRTRSGTARVLRDQMGKILDRKNVKKTEEVAEKAESTMKEVSNEESKDDDKKTQ